MLIGISSSDAAWSHPGWPRAAQEMILLGENNNSHETEGRKKHLGLLENGQGHKTHFGNMEEHGGNEPPIRMRLQQLV